MPKIMFFFNWEYTQLCHAYAIAMERKGIKAQFSGYAAEIRDYDFLKAQKDVSYTHLYHAYEPYEGYESEEIDWKYLENAEDRYGVPNLWLLLYADRDLMVYNKKHYTYEQYLKLLQRYLRFTEKMLDEAKPEVIIIDVVASMQSYILYAVAKRKRIRILITTFTRTSDRMTMVEDTYDMFPKIFKYFTELKSGKRKPTHTKEVDNFISTFRNKKVKTGYMVSSEKYVSSNFSMLGFLGKFPRLIDYVHSYYFGQAKRQYGGSSKSPLDAVSDRLQRQFRRLQFKRSRLFEQPVEGEKYVFFPLHLEPEMATMVQAPMYIDQLSLIENLAKSMPIGCRLYVKDHPLMLYFGERLRPISYYEKIRKLPNARLINPAYDSYPIIKNSQLVVTIGGTPGWEAILLKKPVITFGHAFFNSLDMVVKCKNISGLPVLIKDTIRNYIHNEDDLRLLIDSIYENSFGGDYGKLYGLAGKVSIKEILLHKDFAQVFDYLCKELEVEK